MIPYGEPIHFPSVDWLANLYVNGVGREGRPLSEVEGGGSLTVNTSRL